MFLLATLVFGLLTAFGTAAMLLQIPRIQRRRLGWLTYPLRVAADGVRFFFVEEKMAWFGLRAIAAYLRPGFHPADRDTDALVGRALALSRDAGATVEAT
jgi:predicted metal-dependent hydrolase